jgi:hypothetical protein
MKKLLLTLLIALPAAMFGQTTPFVATFAFDSVKANTGGKVDPTPHPIVTGLAFDSVRAFNVGANSTGAGRFSFNTWGSGAPSATTYSSFTGTVDTSKYFEVEIIPQMNYSVTVDSIVFKFQRSGTGVRTFVVRGSEDNFTTNLSADVNPTNYRLGVESGNVFFYWADSTAAVSGATVYPGVDYVDATTPLRFRFYGFNSEANTGTFSIDNVAIYGTTTFITSIMSIGKEAILIYPNPVNSGNLTVQSASGDKSIEVIDITGKVVMSVNSNEAVTLIPASTLAKGTYVVRITSAEGMTMTKFIKN